jgi:hypothetical protein
MGRAIGELTRRSRDRPRQALLLRRETLCELGFDVDVPVQLLDEAIRNLGSRRPR